MSRFVPVLRWIVALGTLVSMTGVFVAPAWACHAGWLTRWQLIPAVMSCAVLPLVVLGLSVALFGRLYCSVACPLGIAQDVFRLVTGWLLPARAAKPVSKAVRAVRLALLVVFAAGAVFGLTGLVAPYGIFARFIAVGIRRVGEPAVVVTVWAIALFAFVMAMTLVRARWWCNRVCPVGTFLGLFVRWSFFHVRIDASTCMKCGLCAKKCDKGALAVSEDRTVAVDTASCVACLDCVGVCKKGALTWR